jgi:hypothetical protein
VSRLPLVVVGHPEHKRVERFVRAVLEAGHERPRVVAHAELLRDPERLLELPDEPCFVRIESLGQSADADRALLRLGHAGAVADGRCRVITGVEIDRPFRRGELVAPKQLHFGLLRYLRALDRVARARPSWRFLTAPLAIGELFDKNRTAERLALADLTTTRRVFADDSDALLATLEAQRCTLYVKLFHGSSASGLAVVRSNGRTFAMNSTVAREGDRFFNSRRIHRYDRPDAARPVLDFLFAEGARVEHAIPKARFAGRHVDLRVLVVGFEPAVIVLRTSAHPITNLHLGGRPGDVDAFRASVPADAWSRALDACTGAAELFDSFQLGVDLVLRPHTGEHTILEANAFGDLLPGARAHGREVFEHEVQMLARAAGGLG